ncbi:ulp1 protease family, C-terminal catalytic domain-containing protein [Artemisia annua]|uniref:Ulp1 protease family, C-terminal catalytic domain-containing protein n=1 Tax=Artemisia annua TaxID=35608 RepID=A0A2U1NDV3_ARTAN|nr:ulp1 protease family, C-terminal catalytic domain-containing protein [Artemisia annua]
MEQPGVSGTPQDKGIQSLSSNIPDTSLVRRRRGRPIKEIPKVSGHYATTYSSDSLLTNTSSPMVITNPTVGNTNILPIHRGNPPVNCITNVKLSNVSQFNNENIATPISAKTNAPFRVQATDLLPRRRGRPPLSDISNAKVSTVSPISNENTKGNIVTPISAKTNTPFGVQDTSPRPRGRPPINDCSNVLQKGKRSHPDQTSQVDNYDSTTGRQWDYTTPGSSNVSQGLHHSTANSNEPQTNIASTSRKHPCKRQRKVIYEIPRINFDMDEDEDVFGSNDQDKFYGICPEYVDHGDPTNKCSACNALLWDFESRLRRRFGDGWSYSTCCLYGKVKVAKLKEAPKPLSGSKNETKSSDSLDPQIIEDLEIRERHRKNLCLKYIDILLRKNGSSLSSINGMPLPDLEFLENHTNSLIHDEICYDPDLLKAEHDTLFPISFVKPNAIERKRKDVDKGKMPKKTSEIEPVRNKRLVKLTTTMESPFKDRFVKLGVKCSQDEELLFDCIFSSTKEPCDFVFATENGFALIRGIIESLYPGITLHVEVINVWSQICNFDERLRNPISMRRLFCHTGMMNENFLNEKMSLGMLLAFNDNIDNVLKSANVEKISDVDLVFFPVLLEKSHYYLVVFNLKTPKIEIIDNSKNGSEADMKERYGKSLKKLRKYFLLYLGVKDHPRLELLKKVAFNILLMSWRTEENCIDCGVFMMRHMETYMGYNSAKNWKCGLKDEGPEQQNQIYELRKKYLSKILRSDINIKRSLVLDELEEYRRLPSDAKENLKNNRLPSLTRDNIQKYMDFQKKSKCTDLVKYSKLTERRAKEQESTSTTLSLVKFGEAVKNAPSFDAPSFDLGLTPTPPDADIKYQAEVVAPMVANENLKLLAEKANEQEPTTTTSPFAALPLSFAMPSTSIITPAIESKRIVKPSETVKSPFLDRIVKLGDKCSQDEELLFDCMSLSTKNPCDFLFQTKNGFYIMRGQIESLYPGITVRTGVINGWSHVCNYEERLRSSDSMRRLFCHAGMISERMLEETNIVKAQTEFIENMTIVMKNANVDKISDIDMIRLFLGYLAFVEHPKFYSLRKVVCKRLEMSWRTEDNCIDSGVFLMRHMETYMGSALKNWKCGFKNEELNQQNQIYGLRKKYTSKILKSDINVNKKKCVV